MPSVYKIPPIPKNSSHDTGVFEITVPILVIIDQPITTYKIREIVFHFSRLMELNTIPTTVQNAFTPKSHQPLAPPISKSDTGMYVPSISKNMEQWSNILRTFFAVL